MCTLTRQDSLHLWLVCSATSQGASGGASAETAVAAGYVPVEASIALDFAYDSHQDSSDAEVFPLIMPHPCR